MVFCAHACVLACVRHTLSLARWFRGTSMHACTCTFFSLRCVVVRGACAWCVCVCACARLPARTREAIFAYLFIALCPVRSAPTAAAYVCIRVRTCAYVFVRVRTCAYMCVCVPTLAGCMRALCMRNGVNDRSIHASHGHVLHTCFTLASLSAGTDGFTCAHATRPKRSKDKSNNRLFTVVYMHNTLNTLLLIY